MQEYLFLLANPNFSFSWLVGTIFPLALTYLVVQNSPRFKDGDRSKLQGETFIDRICKDKKYFFGFLAFVFATVTSDFAIPLVGYLVWANRETLKQTFLNVPLQDRTSTPPAPEKAKPAIPDITSSAEPWTIEK